MPQIMDHESTIHHEERGCFTLSIRISHPDRDLCDLEERLGRSPGTHRISGERRRTPKGRLLPGVYRESQWMTRAPRMNGIGALIDWASSLLEKDAGYVHELRISGGRIEFFIGCFVDSQLGGEISVEQLQRCAELGVSLSFDIYGPDGRTGSAAVHDE